MAKTKTAQGTMPVTDGAATSTNEGAYKHTAQTYGGMPATPNVQEWPSYSGKPHRTGGATKSSGGKKKGY